MDSRDLLRSAATIALLCLAISGCIPTVYTCETDDNCRDRGVQGACEVTGHCSYPDATCESRRRYDGFAPAPLARQCVDEPGLTTTAMASTSSTSGPMEATSSADTSACQPEECVDEDGDCYGDGFGCIAPDCDDANPANHDRCFYVAPSGDDAGDGSASAPWFTFERALAALTPGTSLVLLDGMYPIAVHGALRVDCRNGGNAMKGIPDAPIVVRAENERQAIISTGGAGLAIGIAYCDDWSVVGLTARGDDRKPSEGGASGLVHVLGSERIALTRILAATNNRYFNAALYSVYESKDVLVEECEAHDFHRWAFLAWHSDDVTFRRSFVDAGHREDLPPCPTTSPEPDAPYCTSVPGGDTGFLFWSSVSSLRVENCIVQGPVSDGVAVGTGATNVAVEGSIFLGPGYGVQTSYQGDDAATRLKITDTLVINPQYGGVYLASPVQAEVSGVSVIGSKDDGVEVGESLNAPCSAQLAGVCTVDVDRTLVLNSTNDGYALWDPVDWTLADSIAYANGTDFPAGDPIDDDAGRITRSQIVDAGIGVGPGQCAVYIPDDSPAAGAAEDGQDIGANILWRIEEGPTGEPLWDPTTGAFPCGAEVEGVNDNPAVSCATVHTRLNVFSNGCPRPE